MMDLWGNCFFTNGLKSIAVMNIKEVQAMDRTLKELSHQGMNRYHMVPRNIVPCASVLRRTEGYTDLDELNRLETGNPPKNSLNKLSYLPRQPTGSTSVDRIGLLSNVGKYDMALLKSKISHDNYLSKSMLGPMKTIKTGILHTIDFLVYAH